MTSCWLSLPLQQGLAEPVELGAGRSHVFQGCQGVI